MSKSSSKQTVGYWYKLLHHFGLCEGPVDALLEFRAGDRTAWRGLATHSQRINVNKPKLWGGEESEGGLVGDFDLMMGEPTQQPNDYLSEQLGEDQPAYRGKVGIVWRGGKWGAMNPYPKPASFKLRRVLEGWDNDTPWYPEKAEIVMIPPQPLALYFALDLSGSMNEITPNGESRLANMKTAVTGALDAVGRALLPAGLRLDVMIVGWGGTPSNMLARQSILRRSVDQSALDDLISWVSGRSADYGTYFPSAVEDAGDFFAGSDDAAIRMSLFVTDGEPTFYSDGSWDSGEPATAAATEAGETLLAVPEILARGFNIDLGNTTQTAKLDNSEAGPPVVQGGEPSALTNAILEALGGLIGMNPIHILYDALTHRRMQGEPVGMINDANWRAAADKLYDEGFGLCTSYEGGPVRDFQRRILDVIAGGMTQSRVDGLYYIDLVRGDYDFESLPIIGPDDIVELTREPSIVTEQVNQIVVEWFDPQTKQDRATAPVQSLGAIQAAGRVIGETREYPEIPEGGLALRAAGRDLQAASAPVSRFRITLNRRNFDLRPGRQFRLQYPPEGITDMVCMLATNDSGTLTDGRLTFDAVQDVFGMPSTVYAQPEPGLDVPGDNRPVAPTHQRIIEAPYIELVTTLSRPDLDYLPADAGFVLTMAARPSVGLHYTVATAADGESYQTYGTAEWCPTATIVEAAGRLDTEFTLSGGVDLEDVEVGTWAAWDEEVVRVDAIDAEAGTLTLGRACADTVPQPHVAGSRIWFCGEWVGSDAREYADGETVRAKLLTRTSTDELSLSTAPEISVELARRFDRPYPPGQFTVNGEAYPDALTVTFSDPDAISVSWVPRDRLLQDDQLIDTTAGGVGPEPGTTFTVQILDAGDNSLFAEQTELASAPAEFALTGFEGDAIRVRLFSVRGGVVSWQMHDWGPIRLGGVRATESGDLRVTEDSQTRGIES